MNGPHDTFVLQSLFVCLDVLIRACILAWWFYLSDKCRRLTDERDFARLTSEMWERQSRRLYKAHLAKTDEVFQELKTTLDNLEDPNP